MSVYTRKKEKILPHYYYTLTFVTFPSSHTKCVSIRHIISLSSLVFYFFEDARPYLYGEDP